MHRFLSLATRLKSFILSELGIKSEEIQSFSAIVKLLHSPRDPSGLAVIRILFGKPLTVFFIFIPH